MQDTIEKIKSLITISEIISKKISIKATGGGRFSSHCPFHNDKTASFKIDNNRGIYKCFGCQAGGDMFKFIQDYENLPDFKSALKSIAAIIGFELEMQPYDTQKHEEINQIYKINEDACNFFIESLQRSTEAKKYLFEKRKIQKADVEKFKIGYAPDSYNNLITFLETKGHKKNDILKSGFAKSSTSGKIYSIFRDRIIIPIFDKSNRCIAFGGRVLNEENEPKYLNSYETKIFKKGQTLFNIDKLQVIKGGYIVIAEGYMDVLSLSEAGFNAVAPLGTAITIDQIMLLKRFQCPIITWLDSDNAGLQASFKLAKTILETVDFIDIKFIILDCCKDPDEYIKKFGKDAAINLTKNALTLPEFIWSKISANVNLKNPVEVTKLHQDINEICALIKNKEINKEYFYYFKSKIYQEKFKKTSHSQESPKLAPNELNKIYKIERFLLDCIIKNPDLAYLEEFDNEFVNQDMAKILFNLVHQEEYLNLYNNLPQITALENIANEKTFNKLCFLHKIELIDVEIKNLKSAKDENFLEKIKIYSEERKKILEKLENYSI